MALNNYQAALLGPSSTVNNDHNPAINTNFQKSLLSGLSEMKKSKLESEFNLLHSKSMLDNDSTKKYLLEVS